MKHFPTTLQALNGWWRWLTMADEPAKPAELPLDVGDEQVRELEMLSIDGEQGPPCVEHLPKNSQMPDERAAEIVRKMRRGIEGER